MRETFKEMFSDIDYRKAEKDDRDHTTLSLWVSTQDKARYRALHRRTRQEIIDRLRQAFLTALDVADTKTA
jgi:hypothetical protein